MERFNIGLVDLGEDTNNFIGKKLTAILCTEQGGLIFKFEDTYGLMIYVVGGNGHLHMESGTVPAIKVAKGPEIKDPRN